MCDKTLLTYMRRPRSFDGIAQFSKGIRLCVP